MISLSISSITFTPISTTGVISAGPILTSTLFYGCIRYNISRIRMKLRWTCNNTFISFIVLKYILQYCLGDTCVKKRFDGISNTNLQ